ncbi:flagellar assembly peptidoglycan hydrolase FlgJ [Bradyrhizobium diazoefficiens]|nr:flagellar assembly peptidoglycan hydrolase FlgJ [Bradyrhizobium diazoefficiens]MBR0846845.1 flagellar assembly peptidoglycan hydrolase FlgJ [Bradyrhizobium diazoefficiens]
MQSSSINTAHVATSAFANPAFAVESRNGRPDFELAAALQKVSPQQQTRAQKTATDFEAMFLNSMFAQMTSGLKGDGPFGSTPGTGVWRSMLTEQYSKNFANAGGVGIASDVYRTLILQQARTIRTA